MQFALKFTPALATAVFLAALFSGLSSSAQEIDCLNYWFNPRTGKSECLGSGTSPSRSQTPPSPANDGGNRNDSSASRQPTTVGPASDWEQRIDALYERIDLSMSPQQAIALLGAPTKTTQGQMCQWGEDVFSSQEAIFYNDKLSGWSGESKTNQKLEFGMSSAQVRQRWGQPTRCKPATQYTWLWTQGNRECQVDTTAIENNLSGKSKMCAGI